MGENGRIIEVLDSNPDSRKIKIKALTPEKDLVQMSRDIIEKCKYVHPSRVEEVEQLLIRLRKHHLSIAAEEKLVPTTDAATVRALERKQKQQQQQVNTDPQTYNTCRTNKQKRKRAIRLLK